MNTKSLALGLLLMTAACGVEEATLTTDTTDTTEALSFEAWMATLEQNDRGAYMVEGDLGLYGEEKLRNYFENELPKPGALSVIVDNNKEMRWGVIAKYDLSYCVSNTFSTSDKQTIVDALDAATNAWEQVAEVRFVYLSAQDSSCDASNTNVLFNVRPGECGSGCNAQAFFPGDPRSQRELLVDEALSAPLPRTPTGILTHELGHVLGFRHEHIWTTNGCVGEAVVGSDGRGATQLTPLDTESVMYYLQCPGATHQHGYTISENDALGAACKYDATIPRSACDVNRNGTDQVWRSNGAARTWSGASFSIGGVYHPIKGDFDGDGNDDVLFYGRGSRADFIWWANGAGSFTQASAGDITGLYEPVSGDFDNDGRDDIFWYGGRSRPDYVWYGNANRTFTSMNITVGGTYLPIAGDFDGDGRADIFLYAPGSVQDYIMWSGGARNGFTSQAVTQSGNYQPFAVDLNNDGRKEIFFYAPGTAADTMWRFSATRAITSAPYTVDGEYTPVVGNFDATNGEDIMWYAPGAASDSVWYSNGIGYGYDSVSMIITASQIPVAGDFNHDGDTDILWYAPF